MRIQLSDHFTYSKLLRFTLPSIVTMIFTSIYSVVDGLFVSNLVGELALSAVNIVFPVSMILAAFGFMLGSGGSAIVARTMGEGKDQLANRYFSMIILVVLGLGTVFSVGGALLIEPIARLAGASDLLMDDCVAYGRVLLAGTAPFMLQMSFQVFFVTAELPKLGLAVSLTSGVVNIVMDYVLIALCDMGIAGAAWGTVLSYLTGGVLPLLYFLRPRRGRLRLCPTGLYPRELKNACSNGSSELMSNLSSSLIGILFNWQLMHLVGESGVAAYSVMMYVDFAFAAVFLGFAMGVGPVIGFHFGADNRTELKSLLSKCLRVIVLCSLAMVALSELLARPLAQAFVGYSEELMDMTVHGFRIFALSYLFVGFGIFGSRLFTDLCNGPISALISFLRTFLFRGGLAFLLPLALGLDGIWLAVVAADGLGAAVALALIWTNRRQYHYW
ncbi:MATE family efflux transporter [Flintibacter muris]|uniref:MATE family efflux transporter n=1 Tax=Flintibacter muris TaxID=2941327 RepID=UPI00203B67AB|nr:MATE family efflux transporter [Flintibacter muris]